MKCILFCLCFSILVFSCNTNDDSQSSNIEEENFYALTVGNSWVYKNYRYNQQTENYDYVGVIDSVSIVGTELINGNDYFRFRTWTTGNEEGIIFCNPNGEHFELLRDSLGYLIRDSGKIKYMNNNFEEVLVSSQDWGDQYFQLQQETQQIETVAGSFECLDVLHFVRLTNDEIAPGTNDYYYADGIGRIFETTSFVSQEIHTIERRLESYDVQ